MRGPLDGPVGDGRASGVSPRRLGLPAPSFRPRPRILLAGAVVLLAGCFLDQLTSSGPDTSGINAVITGDSLVALGGRQPLTFQITGTTAQGPSRRVWTSSNPTIATVDSTGVVTGTGVGVVTITGRLTAPELDSGVVRTHDMRVRYASIKIDAVDSLEGLGRTVTLVARGRDSAGATVAPVAATFSVPNALVVSVTTGGLVTALHQGDATVAASFDNLTDQITVPVRQVAKSVQLAINNLVFPALNRDTNTTLVVKDVGDSVIGSPTVNWLSSDPTAVSVSGTGVMRALKVAPATITAQVDTAHGQLNASVVQVPVSLVPTAGANQTDTVALPAAIAPCVKAEDAGATGVASLSVTFTVTGGGGSLTGGAQLTNPSGVACVGSWTFGTAAGTNTLHAAAGPLSTDITAKGVAGPPTQIARIAGDSQTATVSTAVTTPPRVRVQDTYGNPDSGVAVTFAVTTGGGSLTGGNQTTDVNGFATVGSWMLGSLSGTNTLTASVNAGAVSTVFTATAGAAGPANVTVSSGAGQTAPVGTAVPTPPSVRVTDGFGNPVPSIAVAFGAASGNGLLSGANPTTNTNGFATVGSWTLDTIVGKDTIIVSSSGLPPDTIIATSVAGNAATMDANAGDLQTDTVGSSVTVAPSVVVTDAYGNPKPGVTVTFTVLTGGGSVTGATKITNTGGIATVGSWTLGTAAGTNNNTLRASAGALAYTFTASAQHGPAVSIARISGDGQVGAPGGSLASPYIVRVVDAYSNGVSGVLVVWRATTGGGSMNGSNPDSTFTDLSGFAQDLHLLGPTPGLQTATAASGALAGSPVQFSATANSVPTQIVLFAGNNQTATVNTGVAILPQVKVTDQAGNPSANVTVTFAVASGGGGITAATQQTSPSGIATVGSWTLGTVAGTDNNTLTATAPGLQGSPITFTASATAGAAATIALNTGNAQTAVVNTAVAVAPSVKVTDQFSNPVTSVAVTFAPAAGSGSVIGGNATTNGAGIATVGSWTLGMVAGASKDTLTATSGSLTGSPVIFSASTTPGTPAQIAIAPSAGDNISDTVALPVYLPPAVLVTDQFANPVSGVSVTFSVVNGGGGVTGAAQVTNPSGVATVGSWTLGNTAGTSNNTMVATASVGGSPVIFTASATNGVATQIASNGGNGQTATVNTAVGTAPSVLVSDQFGNPVGGVAVTFAPATGSGSVTGGTPSTNASGIASVGSWTLGTTAGTSRDTLRASVVGLTGSPVVFTATGNAGAAAQIAKAAGDNQSAVAGSAVPVPPQVLATDQFGNPVAGVKIVFSVTGGGGSTTGDTAFSNTSGLATVGSWQLGAVAGANTLIAFSVPGLTGSPLTFNATGGSAGPTAMALDAGNGQSGTVGTTLGSPFSVLVTDVTSTPVSGVTVSWAAVSGGGSIAATSITNGSGIATATLTLGTTAGSQTATASVGGLSGSPVTFTATATPDAPFQIAVNAGDGQGASVGTPVATAPRVIVTDQFGNGVNGVLVNYAVATGGGGVSGPNPTTDANGLAPVGAWILGNTAGPQTLTATSGSLVGSPVTFNATGQARAAYQISVNGGNAQSAVVNTAVSIPPSVFVADTFGNAVAGFGVTFAVGSGGGGISGSGPSTNGSGIAQVGSWSLGTASGANTLTATAAGLVGSPVTFTATGTGGPPSLSTSIVSVGASTLASGTATTLTLSSKDVFGNPAQSGHVVTFSMFAGGSSTGLISAATDQLNGTYTATFTGQLAGSARSIGASIDGPDVTTPQPTITVIPGAPTNIAISAGSGQSAQVNSSVAVNPSARVADLNGNAVSGVSVLFLVATGGGTVTGGVQTTNAGGLATVGGKWTLGTVTGANTLTASSTGLAGSPLAFTATATPGPFAPNTSVVTVGSDSVAAGSAVTLTLQAKDAFANNLTTGGLAGVAFSLSGGSSDGSLGSSVDNNNGTYTASYTGTIAGTPDTVTAVASGATVTTPRPLVRVVPGPAANLISNLGDGQSAMVGTAVPVNPSVLVYDAFGNGVSGAMVTFDPSAYGGFVRDTNGLVLSSAVARSMNGIATVPAWIVPTFQGFSQMHVSIPTSSVNFGATGTVPSVVGSIRLGNLLLGEQPAAVAVSRNFNRAFVGTRKIGVPGITMIEGSSDTAASFVGTGEPVSDIAVSEKYNQYYFAYTDNPTIRSGDVFTNSLGSTAYNSAFCFSGGGVAVTDRQDRLYVVSPACGTIDAFDLGSLGYITTAFGSGPPVDVAADAKGQVYVATSNGFVDIFCGGSGSGCGFNNLFYVNSVFVGGSPNAVAVDTFTNKVFVTIRSGQLVRIDGQFCNCFDGTAPLPFAGDGGVEVNPIAGLVYVSDSTSGQVAVYDEFSLNLQNIVKAGRGALGVGVNTSTGRAYVANVGSGTVTVLQGSTLQNTVARAGSPFGAALNSVSGRLYAGVDTSANVIVVDAATNAVVDAWPVTGATGAIEGVAVNPLNGNVYAAATNSNVLAVFDSTGVEVTAVGIGNPVGLAFDRKTNKLYVGSCGDVVVIDGATNAVKTFVPISGCGRDIAIDTTTDSIYVAAEGGGTVYVINGATDAVASTIAVGDPFSVSFDPHPERRLLWVVDATGFSLVAYRAYDHVPAFNGSYTNPQWVRVNPKTGATFMPQYQNGVQVLSGDLRLQVYSLPENFLFNSGGMFLDPLSGRIYVGDYGNHLIHVYQN